MVGSSSTARTLEDADVSPLVLKEWPDARPNEIQKLIEVFGRSIPDLQTSSQIIHQYLTSLSSRGVHTHRINVRERVTTMLQTPGVLKLLTVYYPHAFEYKWKKSLPPWDEAKPRIQANALISKRVMETMATKEWLHLLRSTTCCDAPTVSTTRSVGRASSYGGHLCDWSNLRKRPG